MVRKRMSMRLPRKVRADLPTRWRLPILSIPRTLDFSNYDLPLGEAHRWDDYNVGEMIDPTWTALLSKEPNTCWPPACGKNTAESALLTPSPALTGRGCLMGGHVEFSIGPWRVVQRAGHAQNDRRA